jgi:hypothetical protein
MQLTSPETAPKDGDSICETCRNINFHDLIRNPRQAENSWDPIVPSPHTMRYVIECKLCHLMFRDVPSSYMEKELELRSYSFKRISSWARDTSSNSLDANDSVSLKVGLQHTSGFHSFSNEGVFCKLAKNTSQGSCCAQRVQGTWDCVKARSWLQTCASFHGSWCKEEVLQVPGMNLIDCENMVIVKVVKGMRWLALSYVWGMNPQSENDAGYRAGSSISSDISRTVKDAISVTQQLGYRYLWVDEYCIDQNDSNHRNDQINRMDEIYRGADLTIVAAAGENKMHGLPGVRSSERKEVEVICVDDVVVFSNGPEPHHQAKQSVWFTRAW